MNFIKPLLYLSHFKLVQRTRLDCMGKKMVAKQEADLFKEELASVRQSLSESEKKLKKAHQQIEGEKKIRQQKEYEEKQEQRNRLINM